MAYAAFRSRGLKGWVNSPFWNDVESNAGGVRQKHHKGDARATFSPKQHTWTTDVSHAAETQSSESKAHGRMLV